MGSAGRRTTPLFDLVADKPGASAKLAATADTSGTPPQKPVVRIELQPADPTPDAAPAPVLVPRPQPATPSTDSLAVAERTWTPTWLGGSLVRIPINALSIGVAIAIILMLAAWILGVATGQSRAEKELAQFERPAATISDPLVDPSGTGTTADGNPRPVDRPRTSGSTPQDPRSTTGTLTSRGILDGDPREAGLNYLALAILTADNAVAAIQFLSANGLEAFALPVDSGASKANNPNPARTYRLYAFLGVSSEEYKRRATKVTNLEAEVARLGAVWQKQHRGTSNFSRTQWEKYKE